MDFSEDSVKLLTDNQLFHLLEIVSGEIKRRNNMMNIKIESPEETAKKFVDAIFPRFGK